MKVRLTGVINEEGGKFIANCPELEVDSFGNTVEEAKKNLKEAVNLYLKTAKEIGILPKILRQLKKQSTPEEIFKDFKQNEYLTNFPLLILPSQLQSSQRKYV